MAAHEDVRLDEVLYEFCQVGRSVRVVAIDPATNTEVTLIGAITFSRDILKRLAARKLAHAVAKKRTERNDGR